MSSPPPARLTYAGEIPEAVSSFCVTEAVSWRTDNILTGPDPDRLLRDRLYRQPPDP